MSAIVRNLIAWFVPILLLLGLAAPAAAQSGDCAALANLHIPDVRITKAEAIPGGASWALPPSPFNIFLGPNPATDARFCRVVGVIEREIGFEVWLPPVWNQRYLGVGNGGFTGAINYPALVGGVARGFATASTDTGHLTPDGFFVIHALDPRPSRPGREFRPPRPASDRRQRQEDRARFYGRRPSFLLL